MLLTKLRTIYKLDLEERRALEHRQATSRRLEALLADLRMTRLLS